MVVKATALLRNRTLDATGWHVPMVQI